MLAGVPKDRLRPSTFSSEAETAAIAVRSRATEARSVTSPSVTRSFVDDALDAALEESSAPATQSVLDLWVATPGEQVGMDASADRRVGDDREPAGGEIEDERLAVPDHLTLAERMQSQGTPLDQRGSP